MSRLRTGPIFTQEILKNLIDTLEGQFSPELGDDTVFHEKIQALQRFLQHGMSRFSIESLQNVLDSIVPAHRPGSADGPPNRMEVKSIEALRNVVKMVMIKRESGSIKASDADALKYMEHFFYAIYCMTEAKRLIDAIFGDLYFSYYKPEGESRQPTKLGTEVLGKNGQGEHNHVTEDYSQFGISTLQQLTGSTHHKLRRTVGDMQGVLTRWAELLTQGEPNPASFESESEQDLLLLRSTSRTQPILRMLPDTFAKFYKCLELSKQWWVLAHQVYPELPFQRRPPSEEYEPVPTPDVAGQEQLSQELIHEDTVSVTTEVERASAVVVETKEAIREVTNEIEAVQEELDALSKREEKFTILVETYDKVGQDIEEKSRERQQVRVVRDRLAEAGNKDAQTREELHKAEADMRRLDGVLKLLEFQHTLLLQDYLIHLEIRPSIIRFQGEAALRLQDAQAQLEIHATTLEKLEQEMLAASSGASPPTNKPGGVDHTSSSEMSFESDSPASQPDLNTNNGRGDKQKGSPTARDIHSNQAASMDANKKDLLKKSNSKRSLAGNPVVLSDSNSIAKDTSQRRKSVEHFPSDSTKTAKAPGPKHNLKTSSQESPGTLPSITKGDKRRVSDAGQIRPDMTGDKLQAGNVRLRRKSFTDKPAQSLSEGGENNKPNENGNGNDPKTFTAPKRTTQMMKSNSSRDVIPKQQQQASSTPDTKPSRNRSSSDPPTALVDSSGPKMKRKPPGFLKSNKAFDKTPSSDRQRQDKMVQPKAHVAAK